MFDRFDGVPFSRFRQLQFVQQRHHMGPGQLCNRVLHNCLAGPRFGQRAHVLQISRRKPAHVGKRSAQIAGQLINDLCAPSLLPLPLEDLTAYLPIQRDQLPVDRQRGALPRALDARLKVGEPGVIVSGGESYVSHTVRGNMAPQLQANSTIINGCPRSSNSAGFGVVPGSFSSPGAAVWSQRNVADLHHVIRYGVTDGLISSRLA